MAAVLFFYAIEAASMYSRVLGLLGFIYIAKGKGELKEYCSKSNNSIATYNSRG